MDDGHNPDNSKHTHHAIDYIEIPVTDVEAAKRFYADAFGWSFNQYGPDYAGINRVGETGEAGGLVKAEQAGGKTGLMVVLYSLALEDSFGKVKLAGGKITVPPFAFPGGRRFHFTDPCGNELGVWSKQ